MTGSANVKTVRDAIVALQANDMASFKEMLTHDVRWKTPGPPEVFEFAGERRGREAVVEWFKLLTNAEEPLAFETQHFIPYEDKVVLLGISEVRVRSTGKKRRSEWVHVYTFRGGKIAAFQEFYDTALEMQDHNAL